MFFNLLSPSHDFKENVLADLHSPLPTHDPGIQDESLHVVAGRVFATVSAAESCRECGIRVGLLTRIVYL